MLLVFLTRVVNRRSLGPFQGRSNEKSLFADNNSQDFGGLSSLDVFIEENEGVVPPVVNAPLNWDSVDLHNYSDLLQDYQRPLACNSLLQFDGCTKLAVDNHVYVDFGIPEITPCLVDAASERIEFVVWCLRSPITT